MMVSETWTVNTWRARRRLWFEVACGILMSALIVSVPAMAVDNPPTLSPDLKGRQELTRPAALVESRRAHYIGQIWATISNDGRFGSNHGGFFLDPRDQGLLKLSYTPSFEFPGGSRLDYLFTGSLWIGGIIGNDTLMSLGHEGWAGFGGELWGFAPMAESLPPDHTPLGCQPKEDSLWEFLGLKRKALAQVRGCVFYDTLVLAATGDPERQGLHLPMGLEISQVSHAGSDTYSQRFVIVDCAIKNITDHPIEKMWLGVFMDNDVWQTQGAGDATDDISGFLRTWPNPTSPTYLDTLDMAWAADNDGDPSGGRYTRGSCIGVMGLRILRGPAGTHRTFNWWTSDGTAVNDWGPRRLDDLRGLGHGGNGTPSSDRAKYYYMSNNELDYGQLFSAINYTAEGWKPPSPSANNLADGLDTRSVLAIGPVPVLNPGETVPLTFALIAGDSLHRDPTKRLDASRPEAYYSKLYFSDLARNAWWAGFVFDNFGVDTDEDPAGYRGEYFVDSISHERVYYTGDGCPDFSGPSAPPCAALTLASRPKELVVSWSGAQSELATDAQTLTQDFEGYKVYYAERNSKDDVPSAEDYTLLASWDKVDFRRYTWDPAKLEWSVTGSPHTLEEWRTEFNDPTFDPEAHAAPSFATCYHYTDSTEPGVDKCAYFAPQDYNMANEFVVGGDTVKNLIQRVAVYNTDLGTYGDYEVVLSNLLPAKHYFVTVTTFDFGDPVKSLPPLETTPGQCRTDGIPIYSSDVVQAYWDSGGVKRDSVKVVAYPNPYKISYVGPDGRRTSYFEQGYEGTASQRSSGQPLDERDRRIHFINLPDTATISIYTLDGDLVRTLDHPDKNLSEYPSKISWDLVSRNTQAVASGIYIYKVDSRLGSQVGKIVIIK
ncbi:MAG: hypothetical protein AB1792_02890 [Candidatus Zixiibacteriota bacterium]